MRKVLLVDDEPMIRNGLRTLIAWEELGFTIAGDAADGEEAVAKHRQISPDLMIVDIQMPGMSGLHVIEEIKKKDHKCSFLILSGYADFTYARQAMGYGVNGYLLKPIDESELENEVGRIAALLDERTAAEQLAEQSVSLRRRDLLQAVVMGDSTEQEQLLVELIPLLERSGDGRYQLVLLKLYPSDNPSSAIAASEKRLAEYTEQENIGWVFVSEEFVGMLLRDRWVDEGCRKQWEAAVGRVLGPHVQFTASAGLLIEDIRGLRQSCAASAEQLKGSFMLAPQKIYLSASYENRKNPRHPGPDLEKLGRQLFYAVDIGSGEGVRQAFKEAADRITACHESEKAVKSSFATLVSAILNLAGSSGLPVTIDEYMPMIADIYKHGHYDAMYEDIERRLLHMAQTIGQSDGSSVVKQIIDFMGRHYKQNLQLQTLADMFNYHRGYLGKLFKNYTGDSFHTYLDKVRIERAAEYLRQGYKVHQAAEMVGYPNVDYFHAKFKKYKGAAPSSFKNGYPHMDSQPNAEQRRSAVRGDEYPV